MIESHATARAPLRRRGEGRIVAGVAAGVARHLRIDPVLVRLGFVVLAFPGGVGVLLYLLAWILLPGDGPDERGSGMPLASAGAAARVLGALLAALGGLLAVELARPDWIDARYVAPAALVLLGVGLLARGVRE